MAVLRRRLIPNSQERRLLTLVTFPRYSFPSPKDGADKDRRTPRKKKSEAVRRSEQRSAGWTTI